MQCEQFHRRMDELLDNRRCIESDEPLTCHAAVCPECAAARSTTLRMLQAYAVTNPPLEAVRLDDGPKLPASPLAKAAAAPAYGVPLAGWSVPGLVLAASCLLYVMLPGMLDQTEVGPDALAVNDASHTSSVEPLPLTKQPELQQVEAQAVPRASTVALSTNSLPAASLPAASLPAASLPAASLPEDQSTVASSELEDVMTAGHVRPTSFVHQPLLSIRLLSQADWSKAMDHQQVPFGAQIPEMDTAWLKVVSDGMVPVQQSMSSTLDLIRRSITSSS